MVTSCFTIIITLSTEFVQNHYYLPQACSPSSAARSWLSIHISRPGKRPHSGLDRSAINPTTKRGNTCSFDRRNFSSCCRFASETRTKGILALFKHRSGTNQASYNTYTTRMEGTLASSWSSSAQIADLQLVILPYTRFGRINASRCAQKKTRTATQAMIEFLNTKLASERRRLKFIKTVRGTRGRSTT